MTFTLKVATDQEAFDAVVRHLAQQTDRCTSDSDHGASDHGASCVYQRADGNRCAVGALIDVSDEELLKFEQEVLVGLTETSVRSLVARRYLSIVGVDIVVLSLLQQAHDSGYRAPGEPFNNWAELEQVAQRFHLDRSVIDEVRHPVPA
jgi:hypothetical protein